MTSAAPVLRSLDAARAALGDEAVRVACRHACWRRGDLSYLLHEGQAEALERISATSTRRFVVNVGRRWGKTWLFCVLAGWLLVLRMLFRRGDLTEEEAASHAPRWLIRSAVRTSAKARVLYAAPTENMIREFVLPHMDMLEQHAPPELRITMVRGDYTSPDGDRIVLSGCEDRKKANRLRGPEADLALVDEGGFIPILGYVVKSAIGFQLAETRGRQLLSSTPPDSPDHPWVDFVAEAETHGAYYHATTADAPHITAEMLAEAIADAGGKDSVAWQREGLARLVRDPELVVLPEFGDSCVGVHERPDHFAPCIIGDLGFVDWSVILFGYYDFRADLYVVEDEVAGARLLSVDLEAQIRATAERLWPRMQVARRRVDATARERADLGSDDWTAPDAETWTAVSRDGGLAKGRMRALANRGRVLCGRGQLRVHPRCSVTIAHAKHARWNLQRSSFERVKDENGQPLHHYDGCAALLYFLRDVDDTTNPFPLLPPGVSPETHWIPPQLREEPKRRKLATALGARPRRRRR